MANRHIYRRVPLGEYEVPNESLSLAQDIRTMEIILDLITKLDPLTLSKTSDEGYRTRRRLTAIVAAWKTNATEKLRNVYLNGRPMRGFKEPTTAETWRLLLDCLNRD